MPEALDESQYKYDKFYIFTLKFWMSSQPVQDDVWWQAAGSDEQQ